MKFFFLHLLFYNRDLFLFSCLLTEQLNIYFISYLLSALHIHTFFMCQPLDSCFVATQNYFCFLFYFYFFFTIRPTAAYFSVFAVLHGSLHSNQAEVGQGIRGQCYGVFQVTENTAYSRGKRMHGATNLKKACPSIWCSRPRLATAWAAGTMLGLSWLGNCLSLSLGTGLRSPRGVSGAPRRL